MKESKVLETFSIEEASSKFGCLEVCKASSGNLFLSLGKTRVGAISDSIKSEIQKDGKITSSICLTSRVTEEGNPLFLLQKLAEKEVLFAL